MQLHKQTLTGREMTPSMIWDSDGAWELIQHCIAKKNLENRDIIRHSQFSRTVKERTN